MLSGIAQHVVNLTSELRKSPDCEVAVCTVFPRGELHKTIEKSGGKSFALGLTNFNSWKVLGRFSKVIHEYRPDVVHVHVITFWQWVYFAFFGRRIPMVFTVHSDYGRGTWQKRLMRRFMPLNVRRYVFVSKGVQSACALLGMSGEVIYNPAPRPFNRPTLQPHNSPMLIGTACRIGDVKRPRMFVRVLARVLQRMPDVHAMVIGDGENDPIPALRKIVTEHRVGDRFEFTGYCDDAQQQMRRLKIFVMTSIREGMPTAALEAMSEGVPIAFMRGKGGLIDLAEYNRGERGPIGVDVTEGDEESLISGIVRLLTDSDYYSECSANAKSLCLTEFSLSRTVDRLQRVYHEVVL